jgi:hypothetical protein
MKDRVSIIRLSRKTDRRESRPTMQSISKACFFQTSLSPVLMMWSSAIPISVSRKEGQVEPSVVWDVWIWQKAMLGRTLDVVDLPVTVGEGVDVHAESLSEEESVVSELRWGRIEGKWHEL